MKKWLPCVALAALTYPALAQTPAAALPEPAARVAAKLEELNHLPGAPWKSHNGDLPHGEQTSLDDSLWAAALPSTEYSESAVWLRRWVEVPKTLHGYDLSGSRIWLSIQTKASTPLTAIVYLNGRRIAMGESLEEPLVLMEHAQPGDRALVAIKLMGWDAKKKFLDAGETVEFSTERPSPEDLRLEMIAVNNLFPSASAPEQAALRKAAAQVDLKALDADNQKSFDRSLVAAQATLSSLRPELQQAHMHLSGNSHIDAAWLWPRSETIDVVKRTFSTALQLMSEYPDYTYTQSAAIYNAWMADKYPALDAEIAKRIKEGRWEIVGGMWVEPDLNMPDGESTARSILIGKRWYKQHYGIDVHIGWNPDSFGYNWQLPQIYKRSGIDYFVTQKMAWNDTNPLPFKLFWWQSPDGSKVLTYFPHTYSNRVMDPARLSEDFAQARTLAPGMTNMLDLYGVGDHGGGPTRVILDQATHWAQPDAIGPKMQFGTVGPYFASIEKQVASASATWDYRTIAKGYHYPAIPPAGQIAIPTWKDELYFEFHRGVLTTQAAHKRNMREGSIWTLDAEKLASLAWLEGDAYPGVALTEAWKHVTFNGFHDLAAGSGIAVIYRDAQKDFDQVRWSTNEISTRSLKAIAARVDTQSHAGVPVLVFNSLGWQRSGLVTVDVQLPRAAEEVSVVDGKGTVLPSQIVSKNTKTHSFRLLVDVQGVPSVGYKVLYVEPGRKPFSSGLTAHGTTLENAGLRVIVDSKTGCITHIFDKKANVETLAANSCGNQLQAFRDKPAKYDAWNIDPGTLDKPIAMPLNADSVQLTERGPMRAAIRVARTWQSSKFVQEIALNANGDEVEILNDIDWHETHVLLKAAITLAATAPFATYEIPYGTIARPTTRNNSWEDAQFEVPAQQWADLGSNEHGLSFINESKYGYDGVGNMLRLTLLRSPTSPDPEADRGHHHFRYAFYPHAGTWQQALTIRHGYEFNFGLTATQLEAHTGDLPPVQSFIAVNEENVVLSAVKKAEDSNALVFHLYEWAGKDGSISMTVPAGATSAVKTNLMETPEGTPLQMSNGKLVVPVHPFEILSVAVAYPGGQSTNEAAQ